MSQPQLSEVLQPLEGHQLWSIIGGLGSLLTLNFGGKSPRPIHLRNPHLSPDEREFEGEYVLFLQCAWRLESATEVLATWESYGHEYASDLRELIGARVTSVLVVRPSWDLRLEFDTGRALAVFCEAALSGDHTSNYSFEARGVTYSIRGHSTLEVDGDGVSGPSE